MMLYKSVSIVICPIAWLAGAEWARAGIAFVSLCIDGQQVHRLKFIV